MGYAWNGLRLVGPIRHVAGNEISGQDWRS